MTLYAAQMDFAIAIERHRKPLLRIVAMLFAMLELSNDRPVQRVAKPVYFAVLRLLRPAESAARRLIVAAARGVLAKLSKPRAAAAKPALSGPRKARGQRPPAFQLFDPRQRFGASHRHRRRPMPLDRQRPQPRIRLIDAAFDPRVPLFLRAAPPPPPPQPPPDPEPDGSISALHLCRRLIALKSALDDLPRQALRYARWQARPADKRRPQRASALRPGRPPGHRKNALHEVDDILSECDWLARQAARPDTS